MYKSVASYAYISRRKAVLVLVRLMLATGLPAVLSPFSYGQIEVISNSLPQEVFDGGTRDLTFCFHNTTDQELEMPIQFRLYQATSATLVPIGQAKEWRVLQLKPHQRVVERLSLDVPSVRAESAFRMVWFGGKKQIGTSRIQVFPRNLLQALNTLAGDEGFAVIDPESQLTLALGKLPVKQLKEIDELSACSSKLFIVTPASSKNALPGLKAALRAKAESGVGVVWLQPDEGGRQLILGTYTVPEGHGRIVVSPFSPVKSLAESPRAQLTLISLCEIAAGHSKLELPGDPSP